jgi:uncharacterized protein YegP (UPF0339 family)
VTPAKVVLRSLRVKPQIARNETMKYVKYRSDGWRWRLVASNGRIISVSSEAYVAEADCDRSIELNKSSHSAPVVRQ